MDNYEGFTVGMRVRIIFPFGAPWYGKTGTIFDLTYISGDGDSRVIIVELDEPYHHPTKGFTISREICAVNWLEKVK